MPDFAEPPRTPMVDLPGGEPGQERGLYAAFWHGQGRVVTVGFSRLRDWDLWWDAIFATYVEVA